MGVDTQGQGTGYHINYIFFTVFLMAKIFQTINLKILALIVDETTNIL